MLGQASPRHLSWPLSSQLWEKSLWQEKSFKLFYLSTTVLLSHFVSSQTKVSSAPLECLDVYYANRLHAINFLKAMPRRISLRYLGTPDCILWSVRFFLTPWERDNTIIRNLVILQSDYMHRVFRLRHLPIAQVASALAFFFISVLNSIFPICKILAPLSVVTSGRPLPPPTIDGDPPAREDIVADAKADS